MKYKDLVDEILEYADDVEHLHEVMDLVIGKAINQERIQIYKTLAVYFSELTEKNKAYLVQKIQSNQVILDERIQKLDSNDIFTNTNDFFDLEEGMEQIRVDKNLMKNHGTVVFDEMGGLEGERPPTRDGGLFTTTNVTYPTGVAVRAGAVQVVNTPQPAVEVDLAPIRRYQAEVNAAATNALMERGRQMEQRVMQTLQELNIDPATMPLEQVDWAAMDDLGDTDELFEDEQE